MVGTISLPSDSKKGVPMTPLPTGQVFCVCLIEVCEGININVLFPFLAFMVEDLGHSGSSLGYYAGGLAGAFCGAQFCSSVLWGKFSDAYGRKPAIFFGTLGTAIGMLVFGTSKTYAQAIIGRIVSGFLCGNLGVVKSFLTEVTDETNRAKGFSLFSLGWFVGTVLAPITGGFLCRPAEKYPALFSTDGLFGYYPYLLPCLLCAIFNCIASVVCWLVMVETRTPEKRNKKLSTAGSSGKGSSSKSVELMSISSGTTSSPSSSAVSSPIHFSAQKFTILAGDEDEADEEEQGENDMQEDIEEGSRPTGGKNKAAVSSTTSTSGGGHYSSVGVDDEEDLTDDDTSVSPTPRNKNNSDDIIKDSEVSSKGEKQSSGGNSAKSEKSNIASHGESENIDEGEELCCQNGCCCFSCGSTDNNNNSNNIDNRDSSVQVLRQRNVMLTCANYGILAMAYIILEETIPLFLKLDSRQGGFGFNSIQIGILLSISGGVMLFFTLWFLPLISCHSKLWLMRFSCLWAIPLGFMWPTLALLNTNLLVNLDGILGDAILWPLLVFVTVVKSVMSCLSFTAVMMQINHSVYDEHLGSVNGLGQSFASLSRAIGPAFGGLMWSLSIEFHFVFFNFITFGAILVVCVYFNNLLPDSIDVKKHPKHEELNENHLGV